MDEELKVNLNHLLITDHAQAAKVIQQTLLELLNRIKVLEKEVDRLADKVGAIPYKKNL